MVDLFAAHAHSCWSVHLVEQAIKSAKKKDFDSDDCGLRSCRALILTLCHFTVRLTVRVAGPHQTLVHESDAISPSFSQLSLTVGFSTKSEPPLRKKTVQGTFENWTSLEVGVAVEV